DAPDKKVTVSATVSGGNGVSAPSNQTLTINDDEGAPTVTLVLGSSSIDEDGGSTTVTATLSAVSSQAVTVTVSAAPVSPAVAGDFTLSTNKKLTIAAGSTTSTGTVTITAADNDIDAPNKSVTVSATVSGGNGVSAPSNQTLTINDNDGAPTVSLVLSRWTIGENGGSTTVTATLSAVSSEAVTLTISAAAVSPTTSSDFTLSTSKQLTIAAGATTSTGTVTITAVNNSIDGPDKKVTVSATASGGNGVAAPSNQTLTIADDDTRTVSLALGSSSIDESGGSTTVTATLNAASSQAVTLTVSAAAVSPATSSDFSLSTNKTLTIAAGSTTSTGTVTITAVDNDVDAPDKEVTVSATASGGNGVAAPSNQTLTITDDDSAQRPPRAPPSGATLSIGPASQTVAEGDSASFTVSLSKAVTSDVSFSCTTSDGTATAGSDYAGVVAQLDTITAGKTEFVLTVPTSSDSDAEGDETFSMTMTADNLPAGVTLGNTVVTVTITEGGQTPAPQPAPPAPTPVVSIASPDQTVSEGEVASVTVALSQALASDLSFSWSTEDGTARAGADYRGSRSAANAVITAGETSTTLTIRTVDDDDMEPNETFAILLIADDLRADVDIGTSRATVTIVDDDEAVLSIGPASQTVAEGEAATVTVSLSSPLSNDVSFSWRADDGSATAEADFTAAADGAATIAAGETVATLTIPTVDDDSVEGDETFTVRLSALSLPDRCVLGATAATTTITDNDRAFLSISDVSVDEGDTVSVTASLSSALARELAFGWRTTDGTADDGADYTAQPYTEAVFAAGETTKTLSVSTTDDGLVEGDETFLVTIEPLDLPPGVDLGTTAATATIKDNDSAVLSVGPSPQTVSEGGTVHFKIEISAAVDDDITVSWSTVGGDAEAGTDYVFATGSVTFAAGDTQGKSISVETVEDTTIEEEETFTVVLETVDATPEGVALAPPAEVRIEDVNERPVADAGDDIAVDPGESATLDGSGSSDREDGKLTWFWTQTSGDPVVLSDTASVNPGFIAPDRPGPLTFSLVVNDGIGPSSPDYVTVTVRDLAPHFPEAVGVMRFTVGRRIAPVTLPAASGGNGALTYALESEPEDLAGLDFDPVTRVLSGMPRHAGSFTFTYRADDADDDRSLADAAVQTFLVLVDEAMAKAGLEKALAAFGRGTLFGAIDSIGYRFSDAPGAGVLSVAGQQVPFDDSATGAAPTGSSFSSGFGQSVFGGGSGSPLGNSQGSGFAFGPGAFGGGFGGWSYGPGMGTPPFGGSFGLGSFDVSSSPPGAPEILDRRERTARLLGGTSFVLPLLQPTPNGEEARAETERQRRLTLWGRGHVYRFHGEPGDSSFDGELQTAWIGLDARGPRWLAGAAVSFAVDATADYAFGDGGAGDEGVLDGRLEMSMAAVYPYAQFTTAGGAEFWALLGAGSGEATNHRRDGDREASDASLALGAAGMRKPLNLGGARTEIALRAEAGFARIQTAGGEQALDDLTADTGFARLGLEASREFSLGDSNALTPFVQLSGRFDEGDDVTGAGLEVAGGLRLATSRFQVELQGRTLALHEESGYREQGASITARMNPAADGSGLSLSLGPTWGAANGGDSLWRDEMPQGNLAAFDGSGIQAGMGYGFAFDRIRAVLTPLLELRIAQDTNLRLGARFAPAGGLSPFGGGEINRNSRTFELQLGLERRESDEAKPEHRVSAEYRMRF
ncbi:MAG: hypothetical protein F4X59_17865, partial [Holophagales bacterium]|nr:hypothetical protein [Holophagales bacterium]MYC11973.1 hypothetical protein [Holophagales bacterium]